MRIVGALGVALTGLSVIGAVTAYGQIDTRLQYGGTTAAVVNNKGNLCVPATNTNAWGFHKREGLVDAVIGFVKPMGSFA